MRSWHRPLRCLGLAAAGLTLLTACSGVTVKPLAEGTQGVLPGNKPAATSQHSTTPASIALATGPSRASAGVVASGGSQAPYNYAPSVMATGGRYRMWWCSQLGIAEPGGDDILLAESGSLDGGFVGPDGTPGTPGTPGSELLPDGSLVDLAALGGISPLGRGGMRSKVVAASMAAA